jgi:hypothetical protein
LAVPVASNSAEDVMLVRKAIQFAMAYGSEVDKKALGGDIDIAIIHKDHTIEWPSRKHKCYDEDLNSAAIFKDKKPNLPKK